MSIRETTDADASDRLLNTDVARGLDEAEAARRLALYGANELIERGRKSPWRILWQQLTSSMVIILLVAAAVSALLGDWEDAIVILAIVVLNTVLGFNQEYRAERAIAALKQLTVPVVKVRRGGHIREIPARDLVPGDIVLLEAGNVVPADGRLLESVNLRVQEAALTGESEPVDKDAGAPAMDQPLAERRNRVYMGTVVTYGRGVMVVTATGMNTELGRIATMLQEVPEEQTPLQRRLDQAGRTLAVIALAIVAVILAVSLAVAAIPEGLPAIVTIALALGAQRMLKRNALVRRLAAVETLGSVTVICTDKTGTLTENRMTVTVLEIAGRRIRLNETAGERPHLALDHSGLALLLAGATLCNDALLEDDSPHEADGAERRRRIVGDPTEAALVEAALRLGIAKPELEAIMPRVAEAPFDSGRKRMTTVHRLPDAGDRPPDTGQAAAAAVVKPLIAVAGAPYLAFTKGAADGLLEIACAVWNEGRVEPLDAAWRQRILAANEQLAQAGMRVLGVAFRPLPALPPKAEAAALERDLIFVGLIGMIDPPRPEARQAVATCQAAGIRPVMITGDHPATALAIAREVGIVADGQALTGLYLDSLAADELTRIVDKVAVFARVSPEHKLRIVQALQQRGHIVAMTGDGVNDAPALKQADIGVAMGMAGTDVAKEAADMVLLDDNFATIVAAVAEGRTIYDNIRKFIRYLLSSNAGELWVMLLSLLIRMPLALLPLQILWINLVTDGPPALALSREPAEPETMRRPPYPPAESVFARGVGVYVVWVGLLMGVVSLGVGYLYWRAGQAQWQTMVFSTLTFAQMANVLAVRSDRSSPIQPGLKSNPALLGAVLLTFVLNLAVVYTPFLQRFFDTVPLPAADLALCLALSAGIFVIVEIAKVKRPTTGDQGHTSPHG